MADSLTGQMRAAASHGAMLHFLASEEGALFRRFSFVTPRLVTGGLLTSADAAGLVAGGVTHVLNLAETEDMPWGVAYLHNPTADDGTHKPPSWFEASLNFALPALAEPRHKVYCHCQAGYNRGPSTAYCILRALGLDAQLTEALIRSHRPVVGLRYKADADLAVVALGYQ
jgi:hypothetical protein